MEKETIKEDGEEETMKKRLRLNVCVKFHTDIG